MATKQKAGPTAELLPLETKTTFVGRRGEEVTIKDPGALASEAQVMVLYKAGVLVVAKDATTPFTKGQASFVLDRVNGNSKKA